MTVTNDDVIGRIRAASEELTGRAPAPAERSSRKASDGRSALVLASAACIVGLVAMLAWVGAQRDDTVPTAETRTRPAGFSVSAAAGTWWDLDVAPDGFRGWLNEDLAATSVCVEWDATAATVECTRLEGAIAADYFDFDTPSSGDETERAWSVRTVFAFDADRYTQSGVDATSVSNVSVRGSDGTAIITNDESLVIWPVDSYRHVVISSPALSVEELTGIAGRLVEQTWPTSVELPLAVVTLGEAWSSGGNNHPYLLAARDVERGECVGIAYRPNLDSSGSGACAGDEELSWTVGTIGYVDRDVGSDVVGGLAPPDVIEVSLLLDDGRTWSVEPVAVPGFNQRAWAISVDLPQSAPIVGTLTATDGESALWNVDIVAAAPTVWVDTVCALGDGVIPDVVGQPVVDALSTIRSHGVVVANPITASPLATVTSLTPPAGTARNCGDVIVTVTEPKGR